MLRVIFMALFKVLMLPVVAFSAFTATITPTSNDQGTFSFAISVQTDAPAYVLALSAKRHDQQSYQAIGMYPSPLPPVVQYMTSQAGDYSFMFQFVSSLGDQQITEVKYYRPLPSPLPSPAFFDASTLQDGVSYQASGSLSRWSGGDYIEVQSSTGYIYQNSLYRQSSSGDYDIALNELIQPLSNNGSLSVRSRICRINNPECSDWSQWSVFVPVISDSYGKRCQQFSGSSFFGLSYSKYYQLFMHQSGVNNFYSLQGAEWRPSLDAVHCVTRPYYPSDAISGVIGLDDVYIGRIGYSALTSLLNQFGNSYISLALTDGKPLSYAQWSVYPFSNSNNADWWHLAVIVTDPNDGGRSRGLVLDGPARGRRIEGVKSKAWGGYETRH